MGRAGRRLTDTECKAAKPRDDGKSLILPDGEGLRLVVKPHGTKEWQYRFTIAGEPGTPRKESALSLGQYPAMGLQAARIERDRIKAQATAGKNPTVSISASRCRVQNSLGIRSVLSGSHFFI